MFDELYNHPHALARHRGAPYAEERRRLLAALAAQGSTPAVLRGIASELLVIVDRIQLKGTEKITLPEIDTAADRWARQEVRRGRTTLVKHSKGFFIHVAKKWFRFLGRLQEIKPPAIPFGELITDFAAWMRDERGLSPATIQSHTWKTAKFLAWYAEQKRPFANVSADDVDDFLALKGRETWSRISVSIAAQALRAFFRHAERRGWCRPGIAAVITGPRMYRQEGLPAGPSWREVRRLIASTAGDRPAEIRSRAILLLLATYGLRAGEVTTLRLEDLDWERELIAVMRLKRRQKQLYPLTHEAGRAILRYLRKVRPACLCREVFVTLRSPFRPIPRATVWEITSRRMSRLGIQCPRRGPHALRHACAAHLLQHGFSFKEIGDHLGHRTAGATGIYAKVDLTGLREVARFDLGGLP
jgi:integrase/recombinase XerD